MKHDIILAGVGGQGILTIATVVGFAAVARGWHLKQAEVHGMSQRGGDVQSHLRLSDKPIHSDLIPFGKADMILSVEPMEALRYLPYLSPQGWVIANSVPFNNIAKYPDLDSIHANIKSIKNHILIDADAMAKELKASRSMNMVMLGAASKHIGFTQEELETAITTIFARKGEAIVAANLRAFRAGVEKA